MSGRFILCGTTIGGPEPVMDQVKEEPYSRMSESEGCRGTFSPGLASYGCVIFSLVELGSETF